MHDVAVALDAHEVDDLDAARLADPAEVVAAEVDEHQVLGPLLRVGEQLRRRAGVLLRGRAAPAGAGDRVQQRPSLVDLDQRLRDGADDVEAVEAGRGTCTGWDWCVAAPGRRRARSATVRISNRWPTTIWNASPARISSFARSIAAR